MRDSKSGSFLFSLPSLTGRFAGEEVRLRAGCSMLVLLVAVQETVFKEEQRRQAQILKSTPYRAFIK